MKFLIPPVIPTIIVYFCANIIIYLSFKKIAPLDSFIGMAIIMLCIIVYVSYNNLNNKLVEKETAQ